MVKDNAQGLRIQPHYQVHFSIVLASISYHGQDVSVDRLCDLSGERAYRVNIDLESRWGMCGADASERKLLWDGHGGCMREETTWARAIYIYYLSLSACVLHCCRHRKCRHRHRRCRRHHPAPLHHLPGGLSPNNRHRILFNPLSSFHPNHIYNARTDTSRNHLSHRIPPLPLPTCTHNVHSPHRPSSDVQDNLSSHCPGAQYASLRQNL